MSIYLTTSLKKGDANLGVLAIVRAAHVRLPPPDGNNREGTATRIGRTPVLFGRMDVIVVAPLGGDCECFVGGGDGHDIVVPSRKRRQAPAVRTAAFVVIAIILPIGIATARCDTRQRWIRPRDQRIAHDGVRIADVVGNAPFERVVPAIVDGHDVVEDERRGSIEEEIRTCDILGIVIDVIGRLAVLFGDVRIYGHRRDVGCRIRTRRKWGDGSGKTREW